MRKANSVMARGSPKENVPVEGPSVVADLNGEEIVFPLGPKAILSWATCSVETGPGPRTYRCELKPGYEFQQ